MPYIAYCTQADMETAAGGLTRLKQVADQDGDGTIDAAAITDAIETATTMIDGYTNMRFAALVEDDDTTVIKWAHRMAAREAIYWLKVAIGQDSDNDRTHAEARQVIYKAIAEGTFRPKTETAAEPAASDVVASGWRPRDSDGEGLSRAALEFFVEDS